MKKFKPILTFDNKEGIFWCKETGERRKTDYIFLAKISNEKPILFASSMNFDGNTNQIFNNNVHDDFVGVELLRRKNEKNYFKFIFNENQEFKLNSEQFILLFSAPKDEQPNVDNIIVFNFPSLLGERFFKCCFLSDHKEQNAFSIFWLLKDFF